MMTCREFVEFMMAYDEGELSETELDLFEQHLVDCPPCITYLETYRQTAHLGQVCRDPEGPVPEDAPEQLVRAILAARKG